MMMRRAAFVAAAFGLTWPCGAMAQDRSGVRPEVLSLPDGPGSIEGLGESFEPSPSTGTSSYSVGIRVPPGVVGFQPSLTLRYSSGGGNGELGIGWSLGLPMVQRGTDRGLPRYDDGDTIVLRGMNGRGAEDLVQMSDGSWRFRIEGAFARGRQRDDGSWEFRNRSGVRFRFGTTDASTVRDGDRVFAWCLTEQEDTHGHVIRYEWARDASGHPELSRVVYNDFAPEVRNEIVLEREDRPDAITSYVPTFADTVSRRIARIVVRHGGSLVRRYELSYSMMLGLSRLTTVRMVGNDEETALPTLTLSYVDFDPSTASVVTMADAPARALGTIAEIDDVNGDALPDLLVTDPALDGGRYSWQPNLDGSSWGARTVVDTSPSVWLSSTDVQLADMDADGAADVVARVSTASDGFRYYPATASGFGAAVVMTPAPSFGFEDPDVRLVDVDHDRRTDWMRIDPTTGRVSIALNLGDGAFTASTDAGPVDPSEVVSFSRSRAQLADMNGDGLSDVVAVRAGSLRYWPAIGWGRFAAPVSLGGAPTLSESELASVQVRDLNGDGTADLVHVGVSQVRYWLNLAGSTLLPEMMIDGTPEIRSTTVVRVADMNGNGTADIVWIDPASTQPWRYLDVLPNGTPGLLQRIENGLGRVTRIDYAGIGEMRALARAAGLSWTRRSPIGQTVVRRVETDDSLGNVTAYEMTYADGYFDGAAREFRGFATSVRADLGDASQPTLLTSRTFDLGDAEEARKGLLLTSLRSDDAGGVFDRTETTHEVRTVAAAADGTELRYALERRTDRFVYELGDAPVQIASERDEDEYGNEILSASYGRVRDGDLGFGADERIARRSFAVNSASWILDRTASERTESLDGTRASERRTYYDGMPFVGLALGEVTRGDVTRVESWIEDTRFADESRHELDADGHVIVTLDARGARREVTYDPIDRTFPSEEAIEAGDTRVEFRAVHDRALGQLLQLTDVNEQVTRAGYDALGRASWVARPGDDEILPTQRFEYDLGSPISSVRVEQRETSGEAGTIVEIRYVDGLGRSRGSFMESPESRWAASGLVRYGARGWAQEQARPTFERSADWVELGGRGATTLEHDATGRTIRTLEADGAETRTEHEPLARREWDANDTDRDSPHYQTPIRYEEDGLGRIVRVVQLDETREVPSLFEYDTLGNLTAMIDAELRVHRYTYDGRSRRVRVDDPNAGTWRFDFTDADDLHVRHDPAGHQVRWEHDPLGRPLEEHHRLAGDEERLSVRYHYDEVSGDRPDLGHVLGQLAWVEDDAGAVFFGYDERGRMTDRIRRFEDGSEYVTWTDFDAADRVVRRGFPDATHLEMDHDERGLTRSIRGLIPELTWTAWGTLDTARFGNGTTDRREYDDRQRLRRMVATGAEGGVLRDLHYGLDRASRITTITDGRVGVPAIEDLSFTDLEFDDLHRLVGATDRIATTSWTYDDVGNVLSVSSGHPEPFLNVTNRYGEDGAGPDQLTHWGDERFEYDDAGRVIWDGTRTLEWNAEGRLMRVLRDGVTEEYVYGFDDERVIKRTSSASGSDEARYVDRDVEVRAGALVRYVFLDDQRIVRIDDASADPSSLAASVTGQSAASAGLLLVTIGGLLVLVVRTRRPLLSAGTALLVISCIGDPASVRATSVGIDAWPSAAVLYLSDAAATPVALADAGGAVVEHWAHHPYGSVRVEAGDVSEAYGYVGNERDRGSELSDFNARPYSPEVARFLGPEPQIIELPTPAPNEPLRFYAYTYAAGDPMNSWDPTGRDTWGIGLSAGIALIAGGNVSVGMLVDIRPDGRVLVGAYGSYGGQIGLSAGGSAGIQVSHTQGTYRDFQGPSVGWGVGVGAGGGIGYDASINPDAIPDVTSETTPTHAVTVGVGMELDVHAGVSTGVADAWEVGRIDRTPRPQPPTEAERARSRKGQERMDASVPTDRSSSSPQRTSSGRSSPAASTAAPATSSGSDSVDACGSMMSCG